MLHTIHRFSQWVFTIRRRRPLTGLSPDWNLALSHLRHYYQCCSSGPPWRCRERPPRRGQCRAAAWWRLAGLLSIFGTHSGLSSPPPCSLPAGAHVILDIRHSAYTPSLDKYLLETFLHTNSPLFKNIFNNLAWLSFIGKNVTVHQGFCNIPWSHAVPCVAYRCIFLLDTKY